MSKGSERIVGITDPGGDQFVISASKLTGLSGSRPGDLLMLIG